MNPVSRLFYKMEMQMKKQMSQGCFVLGFQRVQNKFAVGPARCHHRNANEHIESAFQRHFYLRPLSNKEATWFRFSGKHKLEVSFNNAKMLSTRI